jgi:cytochrome c biogenesis protein ResB
MHQVRPELGLICHVIRLECGNSQLGKITGSLVVGMLVSRMGEHNQVWVELGQDGFQVSKQG